MKNKHTVSNLVVQDASRTMWKDSLPPPSKLRRMTFGVPDLNHSVTQEACCETTLFFLIKSDYLCPASVTALYDTRPLFAHMACMIDTLSRYDFRWLQNTDLEWASQTEIPIERRKAMMACLLHYNLDVSLLMRFLGGNYTGAYRDVQSVAQFLLDNDIDDYLVHEYIRVMTVGCPRVMNADISRANALQYWRAGNNPSIKKNLTKVKKTMNKEDRNNFVIPLPCWAWRFILHIFATPNHLLQKPDRNDRLIYDAAFRHTAESISINMMTENAAESELRCNFGLVKLRLFTRIYNLRITYPDKDIVIHANDVKSCFRQLKHHPAVAAAFAFIIDDILFIPCGLTFGSDFRPVSWEVLRRIIEHLAEKLYEDKSLRAKHRKYLDRLTWQRSLGSSKARFTPATADALNTGVIHNNSKDNTQQDMFVDDMFFAEVFNIDRERIEQAIAASIEAIFRTLGESALSKRQDPISWDKLEGMLIAWINRIAWINWILGVDIDTRKLATRTPIEFVAKTTELIKSKWHKGIWSFLIRDAEILTGRLGYIAETSPWLRFMMSCFHVSIARALKATQIHLLNTNGDFRRLLREARTDTGAPPTHSSFYSSQAAKRVHHCEKKFRFTWAMRVGRSRPLDSFRLSSSTNNDVAVIPFEKL